MGVVLQNGHCHDGMKSECSSRRLGEGLLSSSLIEGDLGWQCELTTNRQALAAFGEASSGVVDELGTRMSA
jgi:hypothetical protein